MLPADNDAAKESRFIIVGACRFWRCKRLKVWGSNVRAAEKKAALFLVRANIGS
jgi:hypothetical protein